MSNKSSCSMPPRLARVPVFPPIMVELLSLMAKEEACPASIAACITADPTLSGRLLKRANAADMMRRWPVTDVLQAILTVGVERTREVTLTTATVAYLGSSFKEEQLRSCWRHTVACALCASNIARLCGLGSAEAYTAGLMHDIGRLGLLTAYPEEYSTITSRPWEDGLDLLECERQLFGVDHTEAGRFLAERWNLPESIIQSACRHHEPPVGILDLTAIVQVACQLADLLGFAVNANIPPPNYDELTAPLPEPAKARLLATLPALRSEISQAIEFFSHGSSKVPAGRLEVAIEDREANELLSDFPRSAALHGSPKATKLRAISILFIAVALAVLAFVLSRQ